MLLLLVFSLLVPLFANVVGDSANGNCIVDLDNTTQLQGFWNLEAPFGVQLVGVYKVGSVYKTLKSRLPSLLTNLINTTRRNSEDIAKKYGADSLQDLEHVIDNWNRLKNEIQTNQQLTSLPLAHNESDHDVAMWNDHLELRKELEGSNLSWFFTKFLFSECYFFRRINQAVVSTKTLKTFDPFENQKQVLLTNSIDSIQLLAKHAILHLNRTMNVSTDERKRDLISFLKVSLWGNRFDLALSAGEQFSSMGNPVELLDSFEKDLLINDTELVWNILENLNKTNDFVIVDIVLDNAGYELFGDLCLASFLVVHRIAHKVRFHAKQIPWFGSDVNIHDFNWIIEYMRNSSDPHLKDFGDLCAIHLEHEQWSIEADPFWTTFHDYGQMKKQAPALYNKLSESTLVIFKGDLNYRKLLGDIHWDYTTTLNAALSRLDFTPTNVLALRTVKGQVLVGLTLDKVRLWKKDKTSMDNGKYGVISAAINTPCVCNDSN